MNLAEAIRKAQMDGKGKGSTPLAPPAASMGGYDSTDQPPAPPQVNSGNVVRLELFLSGEQMTGMLRALMAGQHSVYTLREAAAYLRISPNALQELAENGEVPGMLLDGKWRFPKSSLDDWMALTAIAKLEDQEDTDNVA